MTTQAAMVTFLMTDIEGSTRLWEEHRDAMATALEAHDTILRDAVAGRGGTIVKTTGDGLLAAFDRADVALGCAVDAQRGLARHAWGETGPLRVRMALHSGSAQSRDHDYFGRAVNRVARLLAIANGGQVLVSGSTATLVEDGLPPGAELLDRGKHRLRDLDEPEHVFEVSSDEMPGGALPLRSPVADRTNVPWQMTSFIGREQELAELRELARGHRLVTLIGTGGTGKTRLMLQVGAELVDRYADGVWLTELAALSDPELVVQEVARTVGAREEPGRSVLETLTDFLRAKTLLLLIDNCEHVIASAADLAEHALAACPDLSVIASSREALAVSGERVFQVPSLGLPPSIPVEQTDHGATDGWFADIETAETVRLFVDRASDALPSFALTRENAPAVVEICRRLDGIPLAIELAAARIGVLSVDEIAVRLGDRFRLLTGGRRTALPRQQTLQALIDWSWDLLGEADQRLLRRLSVFSGGWTLEAAAGVMQMTDDRDPEAQLATLDGLSRLVDRSLVVVEHADATRYRMLETIRQYARERLIASGEAPVLRDRHLAHFLAVAQEAEPALLGADMISWLKRLDAEADNLRAALEWSFEADPEQALRLTIALQPYWWVRSYGSEALERMRAAADLAQSLLPPGADGDPERTLLVSRVLAAACTAQATWADAAAARGWAKRAVELARTTNDAKALADALTAQFTVALFSGEEVDIPPVLAETIRLQEQAADWWGLAMTQASVAMGYAELGDLTGGEALVASATETADRTGNPFAIAYAALARGNVSDHAGRLADARQWYGTAIAAYEQMGDRRFALIARSDLAHALRRGGALDEAQTLYRETLHDWQHAGNRGAVANQLECLAYLDIVKEEALRAARLLGAAEVIREQAASPMLVYEREEYDSAVAALGQQLDREALDSAWADGRRLTSDQAVSLALTNLPA